MTMTTGQQFLCQHSQADHAHAFQKPYSTEYNENVLTSDEYSTSCLLLSFYHCLFLSLSDTFSHSLTLGLNTHTHTYALFFPSPPWSPTVLSHSVSNWPLRMDTGSSVCVFAVIFIVDLNIGHVFKCTTSLTHLSWYKYTLPRYICNWGKNQHAMKAIEDQ